LWNQQHLSTIPIKKDPFFPASRPSGSTLRAIHSRASPVPAFQSPG
jgi:hypothetical protein